jgi:hypothetical protein
LDGQEYVVSHSFEFNQHNLEKPANWDERKPNEKFVPYPVQVVINLSIDGLGNSLWGCESNECNAKYTKWFLVNHGKASSLGYNAKNKLRDSNKEQVWAKIKTFSTARKAAEKEAAKKK